MRTTMTTKTSTKKPSTKRSGGGRPKSTKTTTTNSSGGAASGLKVVHISNPMKVEVSPSEFRSLVQELTGRHAVEWPDHPRWRKQQQQSLRINTRETCYNSSFALVDNSSEDSNMPNSHVPADRSNDGAAHQTTTHVAEGDEEEEFDLDHIGPGPGQPVISCYFGSDLISCHDMLFNSDDVNDLVFFSSCQ